MSSTEIQSDRTSPDEEFKSGFSIQLDLSDATLAHLRTPLPEFRSAFHSSELPSSEVVRNADPQIPHESKHEDARSEYLHEILRSKESFSDFGKLLRALRDASGLTGREVADRVSISSGYVTHLELGRTRNPSGTVLRGFSKVFGVSVEALIEASAYYRSASGEEVR